MGTVGRVLVDVDCPEGPNPDKDSELVDCDSGRLEVRIWAVSDDRPRLRDSLAEGEEKAGEGTEIDRIEWSTFGDTGVVGDSNGLLGFMIGVGE